MIFYKQVSAHLLFTKLQCMRKMNKRIVLMKIQGFVRHQKNISPYKFFFILKRVDLNLCRCKKEPTLKVLFDFDFFTVWVNCDMKRKFFNMNSHQCEKFLTQ